MHPEYLDPAARTRLEVVGGAEFAIDRFRAFLEGTPSRIDHVRAALAAEDPRELELAAHRLKAIARMVGAKALEAQAGLVEEAAADADLAAAAEAFDAVAELHVAIAEVVRQQV